MAGRPRIRIPLQPLWLCTRLRTVQRQRSTRGLLRRTALRCELCVCGAVRAGCGAVERGVERERVTAAN
jgi:hypothetical protein